MRSSSRSSAASLKKPAQPLLQATIDRVKIPPNIHFEEMRLPGGKPPGLHQGGPVAFACTAGATLPMAPRSKCGPQIFMMAWCRTRSRNGAAWIVRCFGSNTTNCANSPTVTEPSRISPWRANEASVQAFRRSRAPYSNCAGRGCFPEGQDQVAAFGNAWQQMSGAFHAQSGRINREPRFPIAVQRVSGVLSETLFLLPRLPRLARFQRLLFGSMGVLFPGLFSHGLADGFEKSGAVFAARAGPRPSRDSRSLRL